MPSVPSRNKFANRRLRDAASEGMLLTVRCNGCRRQVHYLAADLVQVLGWDHEAHVPPPWPCSRCRTSEYLSMRSWLPAASQMAEGITVRRPVGQVTRWKWRDEKA